MESLKDRYYIKDNSETYTEYVFVKRDEVAKIYNENKENIMKQVEKSNKMVKKGQIVENLKTSDQNMKIRGKLLELICSEVFNIKLNHLLLGKNDAKSMLKDDKKYEIKAIMPKGKHYEDDKKEFMEYFYELNFYPQVKQFDGYTEMKNKHIIIGFFLKEGLYIFRNNDKKLGEFMDYIKKTNCIYKGNSIASYEVPYKIILFKNVDNNEKKELKDRIVKDRWWK